MHLHTLDFVVIAAYLVGLLAVGFVLSGRQGGKDAYFLGGRRMHWFLAGISVIATLLSTASYLAVPGEMVRYGIGFFSSLVAFVLIVPAVNYVIIPFLMRLPVTSVYEYIEIQFNLPARLVAATAFVTSRIIWSGLILYMSAFALAAMTGWSIVAIVVLIGVVTTLYTTMGGITAVIWTDLVQFAILFGGAVFVPLYIWAATGAGPLVWWSTFTEAGRTEVPIISFDPQVRLTVVGSIVSLFIWNICTHGADQIAAQRYLTTPSAATARRAMVVFSIANVATILLLAAVGLALFHFFLLRSGVPVHQFQQEIAPEADALFPRFIAADLPAGVSGLVLAALLAAAMSSLSSAINSITTVAVTDFVNRFGLWPEKRDTTFVPRIIAAATGAFGIGSAIAVAEFMGAGDWNLVDLMERGNHLFVAPLGVLFFVCFLIPRASSAAAIGGFLIGLFTAISISFGKEIYGLDEPIGFVWNLPISFLASLVGTVALTLVLPRKGPPPISVQPAS